MAQTTYMLVDEVAEVCRVSKSTVRHWLQTGRLPSIRPARRRLVARAEFERFLSLKPRRNTAASVPAGGEQRNTP